MSLLAATLLPGLLLVALGLPVAAGRPLALAALRGFPRSMAAAYLLFGVGAAGFLARVWNLSEADFGDYRKPLFAAFALLAVLAFRSVPDLLAVRGASLCVLVGAWPLLHAAYMEWDHPQRLAMVAPVYLAVALAIWFGAQPWRVRDLVGWMLARPARARIAGGLAAAYGAALCAIAFTYGP